MKGETKWHTKNRLGLVARQSQPINSTIWKMVLWKVGGTGSALIVTQTHTDCPEGYSGDGIDTLSATWQQIKDAYDAGLPVYLQYEIDGVYYRNNLVSVSVEESVYYVAFDNTYSASTASDYLTYSNCQERE